MTFSRQHALTLPANPRAVKLARAWVGKVLHEIGRDDLADSAELGVSELVTNAMIHSTPPVAVRVRGTRAHPRIEVADQSLAPPKPSMLVIDAGANAGADADAGADDESEVDGSLLQTFGRGLALVAVHSVAWGSDVDQDGGGKTVWFEPTTEPDAAEVPQGDLFDLDELMAQRVAGAEAVETTDTRLIGTPVRDLISLMRYYGELRRELRLVALTNPERYPLAAAFSEVAMQVEHERRQTTGLERELYRAAHDGVAAVDLVATTPASTPATMKTLCDLLAQVYRFLDEETLLAPHPTARQLEVQDWYLCQYVEQGGGAPPRPWTGGYADHRSDHQHHAAS